MRLHGSASLAERLQPIGERAVVPPHDAWRRRAIHEAGTVRRVLRGVHSPHTSVTGQTATIDAIERGAVHEVVVTKRFIEQQPDIWRGASWLVHARGARATVVSGAAAFELDLIADGIGALLTRRLPD